MPSWEVGLKQSNKGKDKDLRADSWPGKDVPVMDQQECAVPSLKDSYSWLKMILPDLSLLCPRAEQQKSSASGHHLGVNDTDGEEKPYGVRAGVA